MVSVAELVGVFLLANLAMVGMVEWRSRRLQWERFTVGIRGAAQVAASAGWVLVDWEFRPGWRVGRGSATWRNGDETWTGPVQIDAIATTREAAKPW